MQNERTRNLNGYVMAYKPDHYNTMNGENWEGWVYLHRYLMEIELGRKLNENEIVHHLDGNRSNNEYYNLIVVVSRAHHLRIHDWIDAGAKMHESYLPKTMANYGKEKPKCLICQKPVNDYNNIYCSPECYNHDKAKVKDKPNKDDLISLLTYSSYTQVGKMFGVSDNAVRKWVKSYGIDPKTIRPKSNKTIKVYDQLDSDNVNAKKLNEEQVKEIKLLYKNFDNFDVNKVAKYYNVTVHSINDIIKNRTWKGIRIDQYK